MTTTSTTPSGVTQARVGVQRFGSFLSNMVLPNIAAFIAWGLITALFIPTGWAPNAMLGGFEDADGVTWPGLVGPMITYLLPLLIAYTGGRMVYGVRGGVIGAIVTMGVIVGAAGTVMFLGAMICGPLAALILKTIERLWAGKVRAGFEMLVDNFSAGIIGFGLALAAFFGLAPIIKAFTELLGGAVGFLIDSGLIPLASIIVEPAKVLFLNNAINHGVFTPLGTEQVLEQGKSLLFLVEANPGPGAGLLLAITVFGVGAARATAPGAFIIQFIGGIHEVYFPYVLAKPILIIGLILGGATGVTTNLIFGSGLVAPASPGSIIAVLGQTARDSYPGVILSVVLSAAVTFLVTAILLRASRKRDLAEADAAFSAAIAQTEANKGKSSSVLSGLAAGAAGGTISNIVFACDAGMGSSAMGATVLRKKLKDAGVSGVTVTNKAIVNLDGSEDLVITQQQLTDRAKKQTPKAIHVSVDNFMASPAYDEVVATVAENQAAKK
jgi:PTS system mannitol-specific IIC component